MNPSHLIFKSRVFGLRSSDVCAEEMPFDFVEHAGSCAALLVADDGEVGLLTHSRPAIGRDILEIPAGTREANETAEQTLIRELNEETSIQISPAQLQKLILAYPSPGYTNEAMNLFLVRIDERQKLAAKKVTWHAIQGILSLIRSHEIVDLKTIAAVLMYRAGVYQEKTI